MNLMISKYNKLAQKEYKTRHEWIGKVIQWELCKRLEFDHTTKWYMHTPESLLENFERQTDHLIQAISLELEIINKKRTFCVVDMAILKNKNTESKSKKAKRVKSIRTLPEN